MSQGTIFTSNRTQNVRIPADVRFPENVKNVTVRAVGNERIIAPVEHAWDSFFLSEQCVSDDFLSERTTPPTDEREAL
ncbi:type II toxin-antitoxin system VapB family antitoxin [Pantoea latae]|uniref:Antitoxin n=1 Tax=Pantoea latae TaxID=1964541 RepID=A0A1V9DFD8_9GAMM|nr:type II toxin-antitoxin system VapB family antitoxin [Pantoea latae]OQP32592.1 antitoxin [Pantoea latae]